MKTYLITILLIFLFNNIFQPSINKELTNKLIQIRNISNINRGGCGYVALYLSNYFDSLKIKNKIINIGNNNHIMIKINKTYIDCNGYFSKYNPIILFLNNNEISKNKLINLLNNKNRWNKSFNRKDTIIIKQILYNKSPKFSS